MKRSAILVFGLLLLSILSGLLLSKASLVGKAGMTLFYREYNFLKTWWQGALLVFVVLMILFIIQGILQRNKPLVKKRMVHVIAIVLAILGLIFTYYDFTNTVTHRMLGTSFHIGGYLFWVGWIAISIYYLLPSRRDVATSTEFQGRQKEKNG